MRNALAFLLLSVLVATARAVEVKAGTWGFVTVTVMRDPNNADVGLVVANTRSPTLRSTGTPYDLRLRTVRNNGSAITPNFTGTGSWPSQDNSTIGAYGGLQNSGGMYFYFNVWNANDGQAASQIIGPVILYPSGNYDLPPDASFSVKFGIPANKTDRPVRYEMKQNGQTVGSFTAPPGYPGGDETFTGLESSAPVDLKEVHPTLVQKPDGSFEFSSSGVGGYERTVATGVTPTAAASGAPTAAPVTPVDQPTATGAVPAPTGGGTNTANVPIWSPKGNVSGGTDAGQSTSDFTISSYREGVDKLYDGAKANNAAVVSAIQQASAAQSTRDGIAIGHLATLNTTATAISGKLDTLNTTASAIKTSTDSVKTAVDAVKEAIEAKATPELKLVENPDDYNDTWRAARMSSAQTAANDPANAYGGAKVTGDQVSVSGTSYSASELGSVDVAGADVKFSLSPDDMGAAAAGFNIFTACRGLLLLAACIGFIYACSDTVNVYVASLGNSGGGGQALAGIENAVPGVTQAKHLASASAVSLAVMAAAAAIVAFVDTVAGRYGVGLSSMLNAMDLGPIGPAYGFLDQFFPVAAITALAILRAAFPYFVAPVYLGAASVARFLHI